MRPGGIPDFLQEAAGVAKTWTVPSSEVWIIHHYRLYASAGATTLTGYSSDGTDELTLDVTSAQTKYFEFPADYLVPGGGTIRFTIGAAGAGNLIEASITRYPLG